MSIQQTIFRLCVAGSLWMAGCTDKKDIPTVNPTAPIVDLNWQFESTPVWEDNFDNNGAPNASKWSFETGGSGWGNNELQYYTDGNNAQVNNGNLIITAKAETVGSNNYTSTRMITRGKGDWKYGRFEVRAKLPKGRGTWPAIWMLSSDNAYGTWPASGEIDIMEHVGYDPNNIHCSIHTSAYNHTRGTQKTANTIVAGATDDFHVYRVDWTPYAVRGFVEGTQYFEFVNENTGFTTWPFNKNFFLILNIAVGGNWGGAQGVDNTIFPATMLVDYVRVYKMIEQ
ncbi:MAG TPA: glycoside hydrolase family 16 protein [Ferruginibacter sp.]|nr:glycoside hydrolase family 16 protein [Ferruginibacter sp.]